MNRIILFAALFYMTAVTALFAQPTSGMVEYEEVIKLEFKLEGEMAAMMRDMPKERKSNKLLYFSEQASLFENSKAANESDMSEFNGDRRGPRMMMNAPNNKVFIDLKKMEILEQREFMTRMFLIEQEMPATAWKITGKQKMILDYPCMEATSTDTAGIVTRAWFSPSIPVQSGPSLYCNLPGLVLEVNINDGSRILTAKAVNLEAPDMEKFKRPREGKKVTQEQFDKIVAEKMKEMGVEMGPGGRGGRGMYMIRMHQ